VRPEAALRHQIAVLERQLGKQNARFTAVDRAFLAALLHRLPPQVVRRLRLPPLITRGSQTRLRPIFVAGSQPRTQ
jgi:hypothetical protein